MANNYFRLILMACSILLASHLNAQFRFGDKPSVGQTLNVDTETGIATFLLDFNTDKPNSTWTQDTVITISFQKCQTNRGFQSEVFESADSLAGTIFNDDFKVRRWNSNENPVHMASIDSLTAILDKWAEKYAGTEDSVKNVIWKPSACLFDVDGDDANQAFGTHPGQYKRVKYGFQFSFSGTAVTSDIVFEMDTYDAGNTGQTASYELVVALGSESNIVATIPDYYVTGDPRKTVNLAADIGMNFADFSNTKVYIWIQTQGTGTPIARDSFDPTIVFDNMSVSYQLPLWVDPPAGAEANLILDNMATPFIAVEDVPTPTSLHLQTTSRYGTLEIVNDLQDNTIQNLTFPETGALKANDGSGNYTVDVPYTLEPGVFDSGTQTWSKAKITVAAPDAGSVNDDMMFFFNAAPSSESLHFARLELNCGTRIWFDYYMQGVPAAGNLLYVGARGPDQMVASDSVSIAQLVNARYVVTLIDDNDVAGGGYDYSGYDAVVFGESCSSSNVVAFGNTDGYPAPCLMMEPLSVRTDKWGWVVNPDPGTFGNSDYPGFKEDRDCLPGTTELQVLNNTHYITQDYAQDTVIEWSAATCGDPEVIYAWGFNVNQDMSGGYPLVKNNSEGITNANLWAIPAGTTVTGGAATTEYRTVIFGIHELGLYGKDADMTEYATEDFYNLMLRSVEWILGAGEDSPMVGTDEVEITRNILAYPNPANGQATLSFDLQSLSQANLYLVNMMGQKFEVFTNQQFFQGNNQIEVNLNGFAPGIYMYQLEADGKAFVGKLIIAK
ncbi:MAG: T9SS type A sorting domain-containing protein [Saprospiraceae bacterium]|nr:T9SS type A sorting domain-containing protein [Saprospiraceae bacterium]